MSKHVDIGDTLAQKDGSQLMPMTLKRFSDMIYAHLKLMSI